MASRFAALVASDDDDCGSGGASGGDQGDTAPGAHVPGGHSASVAAGDADDDGFLDAFYHNNKASRHLGAVAARGAARRRAAKVEAEAAVAGGDEDEEEDSDEEDEEDGAVGDLRAAIADASLGAEADADSAEGEAEDGRKKRVSKKAERRAQRKQDKASRREAKATGGVPAIPVPSGGGADAEGAPEARERPEAKEDDLDEDAWADGGTGGVQRLSKGERKRQKELERQQRSGQRRVEEEAEADRMAPEAGGVLDARYRRHILKCPAEIAPVPGSRHVWEIAPGYVPGMRGPARFFADEQLAMLCLEEIAEAGGGFLPAVRQLANVATLPGLMGCSLGMPDIHSGYGFAVGSVAAIDLTNPEAVVSPGGVGFDINCGVRLLRTDLAASELKERRLARLATAIFDAVPTGVGAEGAYAPKGQQDLRAALKQGMKWALERGLCWPEDLERTEEGGSMPDADPDAVSGRALKRGLPQLGTLGSGNHYLEVQAIEEIFDQEAAKAMGLVQGNVCVMIHCGSRGLGHQVCTDYLQSMEATMKKQGITVPDRQLCCVRASSPQGQEYLRGMAAAANYAFVNRTIIAHSVREVFRNVLGRDPKTELGMHMVYDVAHNIAKREEHTDPADGRRKAALVHRKGATRSFPPGHPDLPQVYNNVGQPVIIGGSMGTCSYVLAGNPASMELSFGSTCHGAGRRLSRAAAKRQLTAEAVLAKLRSQGIEVRVASPKLIAEEADESYKDVSSVVRTCHDVGLSRLVARLRPMAVIKG